MVSALSEPALALFRLHVDRAGRIDVDNVNRDAYRELDSAGLVLLGRPFTGEPRYHLTRAGYELRMELFGGAKESA